MRRIAPVTAVLAACLAWAPVEAADPPGGGEAALIRLRIDEGKALLSAGKTLEAAQIFVQAAGVAPRTPKGQKARVWAGTSYATAGRIDDAITQFDLCVSQGLASAVTEQALHEKARFCADAGRREDALAAVEQLRVGYPESQLLLSALEIRGRLQGLSPEHIERVKAREREAAEILVLARDKLRIKEGRPQVLGMIEQIEREYPDTSAAIASLPVKAEAFHIRGQFLEAETAYRQLLDRVTAVAPRSELLQRGRIRVPYEILHRAVQLCEESIIAPSAKDPALVEAARGCCRRVLAMPAYDRKTTARARALLAEIEIFDNKPDRAETMAEDFIRRHYADFSRSAEAAEWVLVLHLCIAEAARLQEDFEKALLKCDEVMRLFRTLPGERQQTLNTQRLLKRALFQRFLALVESGADRAAAIAAGSELMNRFPDERSDDVVRRRLGLLPGTQASP